MLLKLSPVAFLVQSCKPAEGLISAFSLTHVYIPLPYFTTSSRSKKIYSLWNHGQNKFRNLSWDISVSKVTS